MKTVWQAAAASWFDVPETSPRPPDPNPNSRISRARSAAAWPRSSDRGPLVFVAGDIVWDVLADVFHKQPFPSVADAIYLVGYPFLAAGLVGFVRSRIPGRDRASLIDALVIGSAVTVVAWVFWIDRYADQGHLRSLETLISIAYPVMDVVLIAVLARLAISPGSRKAAYRLLMSSL